jgi:thiol-disulfide isomerase/thioredoxin
MAIRFVITAAIFLLLPSAFSAATERTAEEFRKYAARRLAEVDDQQLTAFVDAVDQDSDGTISDAEFANRIDIFQRIFKTVQPIPTSGGHALPDNWLTDFQQASEKSSETGKPILAMFSASWCGPCKAMIANVYPTDEAKQALAAFVPVYIDSEKETDLAAKNDIRAYPTFVCFDTSGKAIDQHVGGGDVDKFVEMLSGFADAATELSNESAAPGTGGQTEKVNKPDTPVANPQP